MTLTEEQRAALAHAINYIDETDLPVGELDGFDREVLRAMIDSSEHIPDATKMVGFDLERARGLRDFLQDDCAEVGDVWAEMIAEIERLRGEMENYGDDYVCQMNSKDVRIQELEDALVEERARALWFEGDDPCDPPNLDWKTEPNDIPESVRLLWGESARRQLQAEGKIGPDAAKPRSWQITEEREEAFGRILRRLEYDQSLPGHTNYKIQRAMELLRAMLEEAGL